jgi:hypothetical protein
VAEVADVGAGTSVSENCATGGPPKYCWYSASEEIRHGVLRRVLPRLSADCVYPMKAGTAVATSTTEFGKAFFSTM